MKQIFLCKWIRSGATVLGCLALFTAPANRAVAQSNEIVSPVAATNSVSAEAAQPAVQQRDSGPPQDMVVFGRSAVLSAEETANDMVVIGGSATALGRVHGDLVSIWGNVTLSNEVNGDVVAVLGNVKLETNAVVHGDLVAVGGNIDMGPNTRVRGEAVAVGGALERAAGATVKGQVVQMPGFKWLGEWLEQCAFKMRPLAPGLGWLWVITGILLVIYLLIAIAFPRPVQACVDEITHRPVTTVLIGLLTKFLVPFVFLILVATGVGVFVIPFLLIALMIAGMIGKIALLQYFGQQIGRQTGLGALQRPLPAFLLGWVILTALFLVPVLGFIVLALTGMWALGAAVMALFSGRRSEVSGKSASPATGSGVAPANTSPGMMAAETAVPVTGSPSGRSAAQAGTPEPTNASAAPPLVCAAPIQTPGAITTSVHELLSYPKAGFWERVGAAFLDIVVVALIAGIAHGPLGFVLRFGHGPPTFFIIALAYFAGLWAWKGTTIGGIVLKLHVVRCDGQPVNFLVALVRGLAAALSVVALFLGFLWIAWDNDKQGWHDKIAGTMVVRLPRSPSLVCL
ncbi:MAG TPA: RDD family protein [Verrucomicrobiae bacterium]|nr:RDD family protein [Verrucomicrobiae bacterium]